MKSDRLLSVLPLLQTRGTVPATEPADRLDVSGTAARTPRATTPSTPTASS
ncbi:hypothetical protein [Streptomyces sp. SM11]|uniref:hypothetical protein n=1 Tax=Streptomyces sp. SM11 TaxID=565557 RepID=UPI0021564318|nr:hypothetical protein [Streptomyces sp. SM11]